MNKKQTEKVQRGHDLLVNGTEILSEVKDELQTTYDGRSEKWRDENEAAYEMEDEIEALEECVDYANDAAEAIKSLL